MKFYQIPLSLAVVSMLFIASCGGKGDSNNGNFPRNISSMSDAAKVAYVMKTATPDSVARFICSAAIGKVPGVEIDSISEATLYAYNNLKGDDLGVFQTAFDAFPSTLPLDEKMLLLKKVAETDAMQMGYELGLEYVNDIRINYKSAQQVESEIAALKRVCELNPEDSLTFKRFMIGFKVALDNDQPNDIPREIYEKYK